MRYRDIKQHQKTPKPQFRTKRDKFGNLTLYGEWQGFVLTSGPFSETFLTKAQKHMIKAFHKLQNT